MWTSYTWTISNRTQSDIQSANMSNIGTGCWGGHPCPSHQAPRQAGVRRKLDSILFARLWLLHGVGIGRDLNSNLDSGEHHRRDKPRPGYCVRKDTTVHKELRGKNKLRGRGKGGVGDFLLSSSTQSHVNRAPCFGSVSCRTGSSHIKVIETSGKASMKRID